MQWIDALEGISYLSVLAGVVTSIVTGFLWYSPGAFQNQWAKLVGLKRSELENKGAMQVLFGTSIMFYTVVSVVIALLLEMTGSMDFSSGLLMGVILGFAFGFGPMAVTYTIARRKFDLALIDGGYVVVTCAAIGAIIGYLG